MLPETLQQEILSLATQVSDLKSLAVAFERWHQDMITVTAQHRCLHTKGDDFNTVARSLVIVSLNAAIEAAHTGESARGFVVVAEEVRSLALRAQTLSKELGKDLHKGELTATATFQDIQAAGKMMLAAISGLECQVGRLRASIE